MVDKNLFLYDLAVVAILKNEGHYLKEWLDYHLLAGVDHFYLYDNDSTDNQAEVVAPYVAAGLVDYILAPGKVMQMPVYNDAVKQFKFLCRYMAFIDGDEFIYPKTDNRGGVIEVVDEILSHDHNAAGLAINWQHFGSNGQDKADYSVGVLERFTKRSPSDWIVPRGNRPGGNAIVKTISDPRKIYFIYNPHCAMYFEGFYPVNENGKIVNGNMPNAFNVPVTTKKIVVNHYYVKSNEEYIKKISRGRADVLIKRNIEDFFLHDRNEEFDDGILKYRAARADNFVLKNNSERIDRTIRTLTEILSAYASGKKFSLETALACRALSSYLTKIFPNDDYYWRICEEKSLLVILKSLNEINLTDFRLFMKELPQILRLPYPTVKEIYDSTLKIIPQIKKAMGSNYMWKDFVELDYLMDLLKLKERFI